MQIRKNFYSFVYVLPSELRPEMKSCASAVWDSSYVIGDLATRTKRVFPIFERWGDADEARKRIQKPFNG
jgi:hypothetical protein